MQSVALEVDAMGMQKCIKGKMEGRNKRLKHSSIAASHQKAFSRAGNEHKFEAVGPMFSALPDVLLALWTWSPNRKTVNDATSLLGLL